MDAILKEINAVVGVTGTFVCRADGTLVGQAMPPNYDTAQIDIAARVASQTFQALESTDQRVNDFDLTFDKGRLFFKNLTDGILGIVCVRTVNVPLLNLAANTAVKKLQTELGKPLESKPTPGPVAQPAPVVASLSEELEREIQHIVAEGGRYRVRLRALNQVAIWMACPTYRGVLATMDKRQIELGGFANEADAIQILLEQLGYQNDRQGNLFYLNRRLVFRDPKRNLSLDVFLDVFELYHRLDLVPFLTQESVCLPATALLLVRMQLVELGDVATRDLVALFLEHDLSVGTGKGKLDASYITRLCADDWGWFKTISLNLDRVITFANASLAPAERNMAVERAQRLKQSMDNAPKSLRWQTRARLGEGVKWYETPQIYKPKSARPDMAFG